LTISAFENVKKDGIRKLESREHTMKMKREFETYEFV
jgi:hypothetical protein